MSLRGDIKNMSNKELIKEIKMCSCDSDYKGFWDVAPIAERTIGVNCIICNEFCELDEVEKNALRHGYQVVKVCDHCKEAIEWVKTRYLEKIEST